MPRLAALLPLLLAPTLLAQSPPTTTTTTNTPATSPALYLPETFPPDQIARAISQLADDNYRTREAATAYLRRAARRPIPAMEKALATATDSEQIIRLRELLDDARWCLFPDTPASIAQTIRRYRAMSPSDRKRFLSNPNTPPFDAVPYMLQGETDPERRALLIAALDQRDQLASFLVRAGDPDAALDHLLLAAQRSRTGARQALVAFAYSHQRAAEVIKRVSAFQLTRDWDHSNQQYLLGLLHHVAGDNDKALAAARASTDTRLAATLLAEQGNWPEVVSVLGLPTRHGRGMIEVYPDLPCAAWTFAGNEEAYHKALVNLGAVLDGPMIHRGTPYTHAQALLQIGRIQDACDLPLKRGEPYYAYRILLALRREPEALLLVEQIRRGSKTYDFEASLGHLYVDLGQRDKAGEQLAIVDKTDRSPEGVPYHTVVALKMSLGLTDAAIADAAAILKRRNAYGDGDNLVFWALMGRTPTDAACWFYLLRYAKPDQELPEAIRQALALARHEVPEDAVLALLDQALPALPLDKLYNDLLQDRCYNVSTTIIDMLDQRGRYAAADRWTREVLNAPYLRSSLQGANHVLYRRAANALRRNQLDRARALATQLASSAPQDPLFTYFYGYILARTGSQAEGARSGVCRGPDAARLLCTRRSDVPLPQHQRARPRLPPLACRASGSRPGLGRGN